MNIMEPRPAQGYKLDTDVVWFKSLLAVILLTALWPLGFVGYLLSVYGARILAW